MRPRIYYSLTEAVGHINDVLALVAVQLVKVCKRTEALVDPCALIDFDVRGKLEKSALYQLYGYPQI